MILFVLRKLTVVCGRFVVTRYITCIGDNEKARANKSARAFL